jgi:hypothetical protein
MEATAWASLALLSNKSEAGQAEGADLIQKSLSFFLNNQNVDGGFATCPGLPSNWVTGPVLLATRIIAGQTSQKDGSIQKLIERALEFLCENRVEFFYGAAKLVVLLAQGPEGLKYSRGWPWDKSCFHWVEPTSYNLIALKAPGLPESDYFEKVVEFANKFLLEHPCKNGGWNHGNDRTLGADLPPYRVTTAEALLALQDIEKDNKSIKNGLAYLLSLSGENTSSMALAWSALALCSYGKKPEREIAYLVSRQKDNGSFGDNIMVDALATLAISYFVTGQNFLGYGQYSKDGSR